MSAYTTSSDYYSDSPQGTPQTTSDSIAMSKSRPSSNINSATQGSSLYSSIPASMINFPNASEATYPTSFTSTFPSSNTVPSSTTVPSNATGNSNAAGNSNATGNSNAAGNSNATGNSSAPIVGGIFGSLAFVALVGLLFLTAKRRHWIGSETFRSQEEGTGPIILPIDATDMTNAQIETGLNNLANEIKSIAAKVGASALDESRAASFIKSVQANQGRGQQVLAPTKVEAMQALQTSIATVLVGDVLPRGSPPVHPLFDKRDPQLAKEFRKWVESQPVFMGAKDLTEQTEQRKRQWVAKYVRENGASSATLMASKQQLVNETTREIENVIGKLYSDWEDQSLHDRIERLVVSALDLTVEMMGKDLPIVAKWVQPGEAFVEGRMEMTDISKWEGIVALCVFPQWVDSDDFTIAKAKVYCA
ncbi:hypothetical protein BC938DRAFT_470702 [Jimgerdemannia flammicorona]|uniref:Uncharacterized protein n=1 Tax=Jimgerdemannia flammicorona TaxID=994334 RepID=A0A433Q9T6_9FUNG|nr:hypothetical protein BC938DRAFT_470702 [Jimgerdemannia flammicorona]